ncbi:MAG: bifunctional homocysteine S-methyltransferase/methylenetetrahydrofolate reductase [Desulfobulbus sp.]|nr:MAG: bifunctional homocysteine S-methyltransferase/methylenetetrahydrofolate reductase [Desulfobulbus sp.]RUM37271.1 MAG: bifunctional homocysteine S-methyltransferase/methylenetetrahydrofolate reductase [Desulfobulbus sp.]RUM40886.1 MAG: bifunctional homocysteine S-methyltransferase/methylenetetrahydrofolate reductase [Desulfobulbus sp.]
MKPDFRDYIQNHVVLGDGALGSYLFERGVERGRNLDLLNVQAPDVVFSAHEEYIRAGSQLIETNTFGAGRFKLREAGIEGQVFAINRAGAEIAAKAAGHQVYVAGSVGPSGITFPFEEEEITLDDIRESFREQVRGLAEGGADLLIIETFSNLDEILLAIEVAKSEAPALPVVSQMVFPARARTVRGDDALTCAQQMRDAGADLVGTNCGRGIDAMVLAIEKMSPLAGEGVALSAFPNAGMPEMVGHRMIYPAQPGYMATRAREMIRKGVHLIGGCCGTTPAHVQEFRSALRIKPVRVRGAEVAVPGGVEEQVGGESRTGGFLTGLVPGRLPIIVELDPPTHLDVQPVLRGAKKLAQAGVDAISLGENPLAILRTGNLGVASIIRNRFGVQTIIHQTGRDINALGLQSRMMEAHLLGIEAVLAVSGDSAAGTDQPGVSGVFDLRSNGLIRMLDGLNRGLNMAGRSVKEQTNFSIGAAFSFRPANPGLQISRLEKKSALGARYAMTQPLFSRDEVEQMMERVAHLDMLIFPGIFPLISSRNAEFLHNEVPGISVPDDLRKKLAEYEEVADQRKVALEYTARLIEDISAFADGLYLISPLNKWDIVLDFVIQARNAGWKGSGRADKLCAA